MLRAFSLTEILEERAGLLRLKTKSLFKSYQFYLGKFYNNIHGNEQIQAFRFMMQVKFTFDSHNLIDHQDLKKS